MPDEIGESLGWRRADSGDETPVEGCHDCPRRAVAHLEGHGQQQRG